VDHGEVPDSLVAWELLVSLAPPVKSEHPALEATRVSGASLVRLVQKAHRATLETRGRSDSKDRSDHRVSSDHPVFRDSKVRLGTLDLRVRWDSPGRWASLVSRVELAALVPPDCRDLRVLMDHPEKRDRVELRESQATLDSPDR